MLPPAHYLAQAATPTAPAAPPGYLPLSQAERALDLQAAHLERYYRLLIRALFNYKAQKT